jgi:hypothetical protein
MHQARFIEVDAGVRYWEDADLNGKEDVEGLVPLRVGERWQPVIELATGRILNWPQGLEANIHYKVCDDGEYWLLDAEQKRIAKWKGYYVPDSILCVGDEGFGDYIIFKVDHSGMVTDWRPPHLDIEGWVPV